MAELDRTQPVGDPHELREREYQRRKERDQRERERQAREARKAEAKQQAPVNWDSWYAAFDARLEQHFFSGDSGVGGVFKDAIGAVLGKKAAQVRDEFKRADEEMRCGFEAKLTEQREQFLASNNQAAWVGWVDSRISATFTHGRDVLIEEVRRVIEEAQRLLEVKFVALEERVKAGLPSKLPSAKVYQSGTVHYSGDVVTHVGATYQATCDTCREPPHDDWVCIACAGRDAPVLKICGTFNAYQGINNSMSSNSTVVRSSRSAI